VQNEKTGSAASALAIQIDKLRPLTSSADVDRLSPYHFDALLSTSGQDGYQ
jgi:hypothetical protein